MRFNITYIYCNCLKRCGTGGTTTMCVLRTTCGTVVHNTTYIDMWYAPVQYIECVQRSKKIYKYYYTRVISTIERK